MIHDRHRGGGVKVATIGFPGVSLDDDDTSYAGCRDVRRVLLC